jgi:hypothetical protein
MLGDRPEAKDTVVDIQYRNTYPSPQSTGLLTTRQIFHTFLIAYPATETLVCTLRRNSAKCRPSTVTFAKRTNRCCISLQIISNTWILRESHQNLGLKLVFLDGLVLPGCAIHRLERDFVRRRYLARLYLTMTSRKSYKSRN